MLYKRINLRNIGIISHINSGKTTTTERILYYAGKTNVSGDVDKGNTVTDYLIQERNRGITITSAAVSYDWLNHRINLIDTPGHVDFTIEVERSLSVLDGAVTIVDASAGVEAQTLTVWSQAAKYRLANIIYLNKYDKPMSSYKTCLSELKTNLAVNPALIQLPVISKDGKFSSLIDIVKRQFVSYAKMMSGLSGIKNLPETVELQDASLDMEYLDKCEEFREKLINQLSDLDDKFASHVLSCSKIEQVCSKQIEEALRTVTLKCDISPVLVGSSFKHVGVQGVMNAIVKYLPSPVDRETQLAYILRTRDALYPSQKKTTTTVSSTTVPTTIATTKPFCGFIFKILHNKHLGPLTYVKICNGSLDKHQKMLTNLTSGKQELVKRVYEPFADELTELDRNASKDDIVVLTGLQECKTGEILTNDASLAHEQRVKASDKLPFSRIKGILVPDIEPMDAVYFCAIEGPSNAQQLKFEHALKSMAREDPSFKFDIDAAGFTTIRGMGKLHLEIIRDRIESEYGISATLGALQIAYCETIDCSTKQEFVIDKVINGVKNFMRIVLFVKPSRGSGSWNVKNLKIDQSPDSELGKLRNDHRKAIENGIFTALHCGPSLGFPVIDCEVKLMEFSANFKCTHPVISSGASQCITSALRKCSPVLLEPIMTVEIVAPIDKNKFILSDISFRRGTVLSTVAAQSNETILIRSQIPLAELKNYSDFIRIITSGRGSFSLNLFGYMRMSETDKASIVRC